MSESAQQMRAAAQRLRDLAGAATPGPWAIWRDLDHQGFITVGDRAGVLNEGETAEECNTVAHVYAEEDAKLIAAMHPGVALALADWLEVTADDLSDGGRWIEVNEERPALAALALAHEIGEQ